MLALPVAPPGAIRYKPSLVSSHNKSKNSKSSKGKKTEENRAAARPSSLVAAASAIIAIMAVGACSREIGDACVSSADCDPTGGTRTCDLSQPGGYCLIEGCDARSCPEEAFCARFFPEPFLTKACPADMTCASCSGDQDCGADICSAGLCVPRCVTDTDCHPEELCLRDSGLCARRAWEKRVCVQSCSDNSDCRSGYVCLSTGLPPPQGVGGSVALTLVRDQKRKFCTPDN